MRTFSELFSKIQSPIGQAQVLSAVIDKKSRTLELTLKLEGMADLDSVRDKLIKEYGFRRVLITPVFPDGYFNRAPVKQVEKKAPPERKSFTRERLVNIEDEILVGDNKFNSHITKMSELADTYDRVTISGKVFLEKSRVVPERGVAHVKFYMTDNTTSVCVVRDRMKLEDGNALIKTLEKNPSLTIHGKYDYDEYAHDYVFRAQNIAKIKTAVRPDRAKTKRVELHLHTNMSALDGITPAKDMIERAIEWGHRAIAITDHGVLQAFPDAMNASKGKDIKVIYGVEGYFASDDAARIVLGDSDARIDEEIVCFDLETTGLYARTCEIIEIGATVFKGGEITEEFHSYIKPTSPLPLEITELTGITEETLKDAPELEEVLPRFIAFIGERPLAAHNAEFDLSFLKAACAKLGMEFAPLCLDTLELSRFMLPELRSHKLDKVAAALQLPKFNHHTAKDDAVEVAYILRALYGDIVKTGISKIKDLNTFFKADALKTIGKRRAFHIIILVKNLTGLKNLYKIVSKAHLDYLYRQPIIPRSLLNEYREGLIVGSACEAGELYNAIVKNESHERLLEIAKYYDFLEIQPVGNNNFMVTEKMVDSSADIRAFNMCVADLAQELELPLVATGDVHFLEPEDEMYRRVIMAGQGFHDADNQAPLYFKSTDEMLKDFSYLGEELAYKAVVENPNMIADMCEKIRPIPEGQYPPSIPGSKQELDSMCRKRAHELYGDKLPEVVAERMEYELSKIIGHDFDVMYMIAQKLVFKSMEDGYLVGSRGSVGSSFVAFLSGITEVNALPAHYRCPSCKHFIMPEGECTMGADLPDMTCPECGSAMIKDGFDIPFQTFLGFDGDKTPDIDLNFSNEYQSTAHKYTIELFGEGHVFRAGTISTVAEKTAYGYAKNYLKERDLELSRAEEERISKGCTNIKRTTGQHPGGVMIVPKDREIYEFTPIQYPADDKEKDVITTHFDYHSIHDNLLKLDLLGHVDPTMIKALEEFTGVNARTIPLDDKATMSLFLSCEALGIKEDEILGKTGATAIPEFGTKFVKKMLIATKPTTFEELIRISGLSHGTDVWTNNAQTLVEGKTATLKEIICTRDDIMLYLISKGVENKLAFTIMESVRKGKGLKPEWEPIMRECGVPEWYIGSCKKIKYMFPKAHAAAYVMMAFRIAWFKVHHPLAFYAAYFSLRADAFDAESMTQGDAKIITLLKELEKIKEPSQKEKEMITVLEVCHEFYRRGFKFYGISLYESLATRFVIKPDGLIAPFTSISGLGGLAAQNIVDERKNARFDTIDDLSARCDKVTKSNIEAMNALNVFGTLPKSTQISLF